jgi:large repetitive protein
VRPASGVGSSQKFAFTFSDPSGYASIQSAQILISSSFSTPGSCFLYFNRANNALYLTNDAANAWQSPITLGTTGTLQNSQCTISTGASSASGSGTTLTLNLSVTFKAAFSGAKNLYMEVANSAGDSGWQQRGTWTVP